MDCAKKSKGAVAALPDDPLLEILSRVPVKSVCRFKCVSKAWRDLIADPDNRKKLPQAMKGLFFMEADLARLSLSFGFIDLAARSVPLEIDPGFSFLTERPGIQKLVLLDSCNGLILFGHRQNSEALGYVVCNPTTKRWASVPTCGSPDHLMAGAYLAFDQAISSHFHLLQFQISMEDKMLVVSLHAYSSETGTWSRNQIVSQLKQGPRPMVVWHYHVKLYHMERRCAFVNGFLHFIVGDSDRLQIVVVDVDGKTRRTIAMPDLADGGHRFCYLAQSQGCMHYMAQEMSDAHDGSCKLSIWILQDYDTQEWVLKHTVSSVEMFGELSTDFSDFEVIGIHQDCNVVFFFQPYSAKLIAYDMDRREVNVITTFEDQKMPLKFACYVPCFSESPSLTD